MPAVGLKLNTVDHFEAQPSHMTSLLGQQPCSFKPVDAAPVRQQKSLQTLPYATQQPHKVTLLHLLVFYFVVPQCSPYLILHGITYFCLLAEVQQPKTEEEHGCICRGETLAVVTRKFKRQSLIYLLHLPGLPHSI